MIHRAAVIAICMLLAPAFATAQAIDGRLKKIKESKTITVAYRTDATPFSFVDAGLPVGYSVDLCKRVVASIEQQIGVTGLQVKWIPVTTQNRFAAVSTGDADMECGASSVTLGRMKQVDFSSFIFIDGTALLTRGDLNARTLPDLSGKKIGVVAGTSNQKALEGALRERIVAATVVPLKTRDEGLAKLEAREIDAFASDKILLLGMGPKVKDPKSLRLLDEDLSIEPYAITLPRGDASFRLAVNTALAQIYGGGAIAEIYGRWFGSLGQPSGILKVMYLFGALSE